MPRIVAGGHNQVKALARRTAHAEMVAFENAEGALPVGASDIILVSTALARRRGGEDSDPPRFRQA